MPSQLKVDIGISQRKELPQTLYHELLKNRWLQSIKGFPYGPDRSDLRYCNHDLNWRLSLPFPRFGHG